MECVSVAPGAPMSEQQLERFSLALSAGEFGRVFRAKGLIKVAEGGQINLQFAGGAISATPFNEEVRSRIVLIGYNLDRERISEFLLQRWETL